jgi:N utilization substance protein B
VAARSKARKRALDVLYEADQRALGAAASEGGSAPTLMGLLADRILEPGTQAALPEYSVQIVEGVSEHVARIDEILSTFSQGWTLERMPAVDRAILRLSTWEILFNDEVPDAVAIDEALELARALSTDDSPPFINGMLGRIAQYGSDLLD